MISQRPGLVRTAATVVGVLLFTACGGGSADAPSANATGPADGAVVTSPRPEPTPLGKPDVVLQIRTPSGKRFVPDRLKAPAGAVVKVVYTNLSGVPHELNIFGGTSFRDPLLGDTRTSSEPRPQSVLFALPDRPGKYLFYCPVGDHPLRMRGFLIAK